MILRHSGIGLYYAGRKHWVGRPDQALDLGTIEGAIERSREEAFEEMEVLVDYGDPVCSLVFTLKRNQAAEVQRPMLAHEGR